MAQIDKAVLESYKEEVIRSKMTLIGLLNVNDNLLEFGDICDILDAFTELQTRLCHYDHNYGITMPDIFEPLLKPGSIKLNQLYEAVGRIERKQRPMTNSFIAVRQKPSSHLIDNDKAFKINKSFILDFYIDSVVCPFDTDAVLVLVDSKLKIVSSNGTHEKYVSLQHDQEHVLRLVGHTQNNIYFTLIKNQTLSLFRFSQIPQQIEELDVKVTFTDVCTVDNDTLLLLNRSKSTFYETDNRSKVINTFSSEFLPKNLNCLTNRTFMHVTTVSRILMCTYDSIYTFTFSGKLEQLFQDKNSYFSQICEDFRGNVFVAIRFNGNDRVCLFTPYGHYIRDILPSTTYANKNILSLSIDRCGYLWTFSSTSNNVMRGKSKINVYPYT
ncbi:unnamed protein product [Mytilus coruscus]|uniref:Uncharacterized protein n=1 Tax=Mytilus coruscus TaxID=42192 RepID=A0A6J8BCN8_MYTCO|nr:unnamed protein product [Mytilus coruscus]